MEPSTLQLETVSPGIPNEDAAALIRGSGEMVDRTRAFNWNQTPLGSIDQWSESLLSTVNLLLSSCQPMFLWWGDQLTQFYNDAYRPSIASDKHPHALGQPGRECWPEAWEVISPQIEGAMHHGRSTWNEDQCVPIYRDGVLTDVYWTYGYSPVWDRHGPARGCLVTCIETTRRVRAEHARDATAAALGSERQRLLEIFEQAPAFFSLLRGPELRYEMVNSLHTRLLGGREVLGKTVHEAVPEAVEQGFAAILDHVYRTGEAYTASDARFQIPSGPGQPPEERFVDLTYQPLREADGTIAGIITLGVDTTERKRAAANRKDAEDTLQRSRETLQLTRAQLRHSRETLLLALDAGRAGTFEWDIEHNHITWGPELEQLYGVTPGTFEGRYEDWQKRVFPEDEQRVSAEIQACLAKGQAEYSYEFRAMMPDDTRRWLRGQSRFLYKPDGQPSRMIGINVDITERKLAEEALLRNEKLAAVGRLASSIAHEINNPLESVTNLLYLLRDLPDAQHRGYVQTAERELRRVSAIANQTLRFHRQSTRPLLATCEELISSAVSIYQGKLINSNVAVEKRKRAGCPVNCFDGEIRQVLSNLIGNAIDAMHPNGGRLLLRSREATDWRTGRTGLVLTVADTGPGMAPAIARRIFEAFYTTKGISGTGLGLWLSKEIVERHEGRLLLRTSQSAASRGTVFSLFLPFEAVLAPSPNSLA